MKVLTLERTFLIDQRNERKMGIGRTEFRTTAQINKKLSRKRRYDERRQGKCTVKPNTSAYHPDQSPPLPELSLASGKSSEETSEDQLPLAPQLLVSTKRQPNNNISMATVALTVDRYGISDRAPAAIVSAAFQDVGLVTKKDTSDVIDRSKIRRVRDKQRSILVNKPLLLHDTFGLYFDGRKDKTLSMVDSRRWKIVIEEHISLIKEPNLEYIGHISLSSGRAAIVSKKIMEFLNAKTVDLVTWL